MRKHLEPTETTKGRCIILPVVTPHLLQEFQRHRASLTKKLTIAATCAFGHAKVQVEQTIFEPHNRPVGQ